MSENHCAYEGLQCVPYARACTAGGQHPAVVASVRHQSAEVRGGDQAINLQQQHQQTPGQFGLGGEHTADSSSDNDADCGQQRQRAQKQHGGSDSDAGNKSFINAAAHETATPTTAAVATSAIMNFNKEGGLDDSDRGSSRSVSRSGSTTPNVVTAPVLAAATPALTALHVEQQQQQRFRTMQYLQQMFQQQQLLLLQQQQQERLQQQQTRASPTDAIPVETITTTTTTLQSNVKGEEAASPSVAGLMSDLLGVSAFGGLAPLSGDGPDRRLLPPASAAVSFYQQLATLAAAAGQANTGATVAPPALALPNEEQEKEVAGRVEPPLKVHPSGGGGASALATPLSPAIHITSIDGFFNRKRGRPPKNRFIEVYKNTQQSPQAIFTSFKLEKHGLPSEATLDDAPRLETVLMDPQTPLNHSGQLHLLNPHGHTQDDFCSAGRSSDPLHRCNRQRQLPDYRSLRATDHCIPSPPQRDLELEAHAQRGYVSLDLSLTSDRLGIGPAVDRGHCNTPHEDNGDGEAATTIKSERISVVRAAGTFYPENTICSRKSDATDDNAGERGTTPTNRPLNNHKRLMVTPPLDNRPVGNKNKRPRLELPASRSHHLPFKATTAAVLCTTDAASGENEDMDMPQDLSLKAANRSDPKELGRHIHELFALYQQQQQQQRQHQQLQVRHHQPPGQAIGPSLDVLSALFQTFSSSAAAPLPAPQLSLLRLPPSRVVGSLPATALGGSEQDGTPAPGLLTRLREDRIPLGYLKFRFNEDCGFPKCGYRNHQSHFHCNRLDCHYSFCDKTRFVQHTARHERLDTLMGEDFLQYRANMSCGVESCPFRRDEDIATDAALSAMGGHAVGVGGLSKKSSHFHCRKCDFICSDTNKVVAHRRLHSKMEFIRQAGFRKVASNEQCCSTAQSHTHASNSNGAFQRSPGILGDVESAVAGRKMGSTMSTAPIGGLPFVGLPSGERESSCPYSLKHTHYHCLVCDCSVLSRAQLATHKHKMTTVSMSIPTSISPPGGSGAGTPAVPAKVQGGA